MGAISPYICPVCDGSKFGQVTSDMSIYSIVFRCVDTKGNTSYMYIQSFIKSDHFFLLSTTTGDVENLVFLSEIKNSSLWSLQSLDEESDLAPIIWTDRLPPDKNRVSISHKETRSHDLVIVL